MADARPPESGPFLDSLTPPQRAAFERLVRRLGRPGRTLATYHAGAGLVAGLRPAGAGYGAGWVRGLCAALNSAGVPTSPSLAYRLIKFADLFPGPAGAARVERLDGRVSWEAMMRLLHVEDPDKREAVLRRAAERRLSSRAVMALIQETAGYARPRGGRGAPRVSSHPVHALKALRALAARWPAVRDAWAGAGDNALKRAGRLKPAQLTDAYLADLAAVVPLVEDMAATAGAFAAELAALLRVLRRTRGGTAGQ